jgi:sortase B
MNKQLAAILNGIGAVLLFFVILVYVPLTVPKLFGIEIYAVESGSMEPNYPVGSVLYVKSASASEVAVGDAITFALGTNTDLVMTHRVMAIDGAAETWTTKGDSNEAPDAEPVAFSRLIGKPFFCIPHLATFSDWSKTATGIAATAGTLGLILVLWLIAGRLKQGTNSVVFDVGLVMIFVSAVMLVYIFASYVTEESAYDDLREQYGTSNETTSVDASEPTDAETSDAIEAWAREAVRPDLAGLKELNSDVIGWVRFDGETYIDYPILYSGEDDTYLHTDLYGNESKSGCIFLEGNNAPDLSDYHSILYGHNMKNLSMFGSLKKFKTEDYYEEHTAFTVYLEDRALRYTIFAYYDVDETDEVYTVGFAPDETFEAFIDTMRRRSYRDTDIAVTKEDHILTLSTCSTTGKRFVVHGVLTGEYVY